MNVKAILENSKYKDIAAELAEEFKSAGITSKDQVHNAPILVKTTHGADIYEVMEILAAPPKRIKKAAAGDE